MPYTYYGRTSYIPHLTPKQLKAKMDKKAKKESEKYRLMAR